MTRSDLWASVVIKNDIGDVTKARRKSKSSIDEVKLENDATCYVIAES